ncbi:MAG: zf-HC2 domain-containing protein [Candidatus Poribacteria bacterium]|nr:zf-HC2 domain-containing protein [Candidatus Poribacteria bacterium]MDE0483597.1 zf-HC2 domain-containing protein [Candidatus Poribacteria bacterium]
MPKCKKSEAQAIDYVYGELQTSQVAEFERHLTTCGSCTRKVNAYKRVLRLVDEAEAELTPHAIVPPNLEMKLYRRLAEVPPVKPSLSSRLSDFAAGLLLVLREQKVVSFCLFIFAVISISFFVGNPFRPAPTFEISQIDSADARIQQYRHQDIQRNMEDVLRNRHLRNSDKWDTVSQLNRVKDQAQGTDWANIATKHLKSVHSEF